MMRLKPGILISIAIFWSYFVNASHTPLPETFFLTLVFVLVLYFAKIYSSYEINLSISQKEICVFLAFLSVISLFHFFTISNSLGGDELYHSGRANFLLSRLYEYIYPTLGQTLEEHRTSMWNVFDLRHFPVIDIWRVISFLLVLLALALYALRSKAWFVISLTALLAFVSANFALSPENHPPLRLLPLFISSLFFGLNAFSYRAAGIIAVSIFSFAFYKLLLKETGDSRSKLWLASLSIIISNIPIIYYTSEAVEPSIWGFIFYASCYLNLLFYMSKKEDKYLVYSGMLAGTAVLVRQPAVILWIPISIIFLMNLRTQTLKSGVMVFSPGIIPLPYLYSFSKIGHAGFVSDKGKLDLLIESVTSGAGIMSILNTTTLPWAISSLAILLYLLRKCRLSELSLLLLFFPLYFIFFTVWPYLWGIGRYQAELVAPFIVILLWHFGRYAG